MQYLSSSSAARVHPIYVLNVAKLGIVAGNVKYVAINTCLPHPFWRLSSASLCMLACCSLASLLLLYVLPSLACL
eukprot:m.110436 g.110436  ORF g.110436 m.110436 type:complete len:75 (+) comp15365_c0_seq17:365-589(+)